MESTLLAIAILELGVIALLSVGLWSRGKKINELKDQCKSLGDELGEAYGKTKEGNNRYDILLQKALSVSPHSVYVIRHKNKIRVTSSRIKDCYVRFTWSNEKEKDSDLIKVPCGTTDFLELPEADFFTIHIDGYLYGKYERRAEKEKVSSKETTSEVLV